MSGGCKIFYRIQIFQVPQEVRHQYPDRIACNASTGAQPQCAGGGWAPDIGIWLVGMVLACPISWDNGWNLGQWLELRCHLVLWFPILPGCYFLPDISGAMRPLGAIDAHISDSAAKLPKIQKMEYLYGCKNFCMTQQHQ